MNEKNTQKTSTPAPHRRVVSRLSGFLLPSPSDGGAVHGRRSFSRPLFQAGLLLALCALLVMGATLTVNLSMIHTTRGRITSVTASGAASQAADYDCILVLGAGVKDDGSPSDMLRDRVTVACDLYDAMGRADLPILMSGDHTGDYNEVAVMKKLATDRGIPSERIFLDHEGYSTYESLYRARYVFGAKKIVIITQEYHLYRALHVARELGMEAVGVPADLRSYRRIVAYESREVLARVKDMFVAARGVDNLPVNPSFDLRGNGDLTN